MPTRTRLLVAAALAASVLATTHAADPPKAVERDPLDVLYLEPDPNPDLPDRGRVLLPRDMLLQRYPFVSLEPRLAFDAPARKRLAKSLPSAVPDLPAAKPPGRGGPAEVSDKVGPAARYVLDIEARLADEESFRRASALAELHQVEVRKFVTNPGFGFRRMIIRPSQHTLDDPGDWSEGDRGEAVTLPKDGTFFTASADKKGPTLPSEAAMARFHTSAAYGFSRPDSWGLVKSKKEVAGFQPHALAGHPDPEARRSLDRDNPVKDKDGRVLRYPTKEQWLVRSVELISLLVHDTPVAYVNPEKRLPTMAAVKDAKTRDLTEPETRALKELAGGKDVVVLDAVTNQVRMVGAIRMAGACTKCHEGSRGDVLGAFSYDLVRVPAYVPPEK
ncbi:Putative uncharacterized protein OS=Rhodopirellula baltica (strain SH1) GN=RB12558 PE=4 SV=1 [Gemmataceae bacterium]|nr:Putative uncharacterized protein OS=Rhodopirellula baltica (strain SH1) GN=RB12558 PE=4 SV=1 [Gemmataceae bacterium]VTU01852.1 Putative uncharacterized protein OS=Rhodopirellula baltica (strain SH1) GN=RB12558 PE=4 SV=1 [Gemmataceae bacterium]